MGEVPNCVNNTLWALTQYTMVFCWIRILTLPLCVRVCRYFVPKHPIIVCVILLVDSLIVTPCYCPIAMLRNKESILPCYTYEQSRVLRETPVCSQSRNSPAFYGTRKFIAMPTRALHLSSWAECSQSTLPNCFFKIHLMVSSHLHLGLTRSLLGGRSQGT